MADVQGKPLIAQKGAVRVEPYAQPDPSLASLPASVQRSVGGGASGGSPSSNPDTNGDGELSAEELGHLQDAAANGDKESWDLLNALKLPLGVAAGAAALYGVGRGALSLVDSVAKSGPGMMDASRRAGPGGATMPVQKALPAPPQKLLPSPAQTPQAQVTDTTGSRFNQAGPTSQPQLPDQRTIYEKTGGKLPTGSAAGDALRAAAKAARRMH